MLEMFYPQRYEVSAYVIPYDHYHAQGIRGVIFDVDNTLVPHDAPADGQARELFRHLHEMGMETCLLSNNKEPRVKALRKMWVLPTSIRPGNREQPVMGRPWSAWARTGGAHFCG